MSKTTVLGFGRADGRNIKINTPEGAYLRGCRSHHPRQAAWMLGFTRLLLRSTPNNTPSHYHFIDCAARL